MIDPKDVPNEVAKAAWEYFDGYDMKEAIAAALSAWPGAARVPGLEQWGKTHGEHLHLPLPQKDGDV